ncbi:MAG: Gfo/Idh/MocA family oxidoreductase [Phycisphaerae bacterium]|nr:Gfo/Idh/MocA family oxidoreductase [Phycisphaerae bacterium]
MKKHTVAQVGCGGRGKVHLDGWLRNQERFEVIALCELDETKMKQAAAERGISPALYADAEKMLADTRPDVFCFSTPPAVRLSLVELAAKYSVKGLAFEKPMATSLAEAELITRLCREHGIKAVVSHQQKYLTSLQKVRQLVDAGEIGEVYQITADCQAWLAQLGTHFMDYILWANGGSRAKWVVGHVHGKELLADSHPSPNFTMGQMEFANGVRAVVTFGKLAASHMGKEKFWLDNRLTVYGAHGHVWGDTDGRWGAFTRRSGGEVIGGEGEGWQVQERTRLQPLFAADLADWLDDDARPHPCNVEISYHGYEILEGLCISALDHRRIDLPLDTSQCVDIFARMRSELPDCPDRP